MSADKYKWLTRRALINNPKLTVGELKKFMDSQDRLEKQKKNEFPNSI